MYGACKDLEDGCENGTTISDLTLGSFIFPFIVNYYYCYKNFRTILGAEEPLRSLADALIDGIPYFGLSVDEESVKNIFATLSYCVLGRYKKTHLIKNSQIDEILKNDVLQEKIEKDIEKCKKAIDRLTDLFLYINSENADYGAAEQYLLFEHDEFTMKPVLDETGRLIPREDYRLSTLNCGGEDFAVACMRANLRYEKNQRREDVKSHHYIISFDPRDGPDNGLTVDRAQELGEKFCAEHFPGHQALVCTHPDGHNHSGNIHVHIVINSLRIEEVPFLPYMDRPADTKAGCKHRCTDAALRYFKSEVMEMCHREGLYQIDLLNGSKNRVTDREYWAQKKGQAALDKQNAPMIAGGITPRQTKFETNKEKLRQTIRAALSAAASFEDFSSLLLREGVAVKESRGRLSYLTPDRTKPITARKLGDDFERAAVLAVLEQKAARTAEKAAAISSTPPSIKDQLRADRAARTAPNVQRLVDIEQKKAEGKGRGYERWATMHNLKQMAATLNVYQEYGFTSPEQLEAAVDTAYQEMRQTSGELKALETKLQGKKELQQQVLAYAKTKPARDGLKAQKSEKARAAYRQAHESDFIIADAAARYFREHGITKLPARKALQDEIEQLVSKKSSLYNTYHEQKQRYTELQTVKRNIDQILRREEPRRRKEQSHER